jgi:hypothetical protein
VAESVGCWPIATEARLIVSSHPKQAAFPDPFVPSLLGLSFGQPDPDAPGRLELAVARSIAAYDAAGLLTDRDAAAVELCQELARTAQVGVIARRSTGAAMAARELRETLAMLPKPPEGSGDADVWEHLAVELHQAAVWPEPP